ncbi:hypothetical protein CI610_02301 [invertebrate metagenome]|uniref:Flavin reductase like domain-containing protein n=1 Tax=invertebrate metagenome TaxID=1711999 RepID=A0A2H9T6B3_9ZZZZ
MIITSEMIRTMEQRYRSQFINSLTGFKSANLIGTQNNQGLTNLCIVSSVVHLGSNPPAMGYIARPRSVERHTTENIEKTGEFTINQVNTNVFQAAHQTSAHYPKEMSEFTETGLTPDYWHHSMAPGVKESHLSILLKLQAIIPIEITQTELIIGTIEAVKISRHAIKNDGFIDLSAINTVAVSGLDNYHSTEKLGRMQYAQPGIPPVKLNE